LGPRLQSRQLPPLTDLKPEFEDLCAWIDVQIDKPLGWQELMQQSGLDHQTIKALFFKFASTTPMTWIRQRRETRTETRATAPRYAVPSRRALQHQAA
jgi:methylphosphotriester-DNA--protein-cysteine methyltransferase